MTARAAPGRWRRASRRVARSRSERARGLAWIAVLHIAPVVALICGVRAVDWLAFAGFYVLLACSVGIGLHRYFAHHAFRTGRQFQFLMGLAATLTFTDPIGFAGKHRLHHRYADRDGDTHRPDDGLWQCWFGSLVDEGYTDAEITQLARDLARFPELVWLHRWRYLPGLCLACLVGWLGGFSMLALGYFGALALLLNLTSSVNYLCHRFGRQRYPTGDASRNNALVALWSFGEGWHNNHHHYPTAARAGFFWWELDPLHWAIQLLAWVGVVWDVRGVPEAVKRSTRQPCVVLLLGMLAGVAATPGHAAEAAPPPERGQMTWSFSLGVTDWQDLTDLDASGGRFDSPGLLLELAAHRRVARWGSAAVLVGMDFGLFTTDSNIAGVAEDLTQRGLYLTPSIQLRFAERGRRYWSLGGGIGWYLADFAELDCDIKGSLCAELRDPFNSNTVGGYVGIGVRFARIVTAGIRVHYADFGQVTGINSVSGRLNGPMYVFAVGAAFGD